MSKAMMYIIPVKDIIQVDGELGVTEYFLTKDDGSTIPQRIADMVNLLDDNLREEFEERAGIMEFDGKLPRAHAECLALLDVLQRHPTALMASK